MIDFFSDKTYEAKLKSVTNLKILTFFIYKLIVFFILFYCFCKFTQNYYISYYLLGKVKFYFLWWDFIKLYFVVCMIDYGKIIAFQNYEDFISTFELIIKIILEPKHNTIFLFFNSVLIMAALKILELNTQINKDIIAWNDDTKYDLDILLYR